MTKNENDNIIKGDGLVERIEKSQFEFQEISYAKILTQLAKKYCYENEYDDFKTAIDIVRDEADQIYLDRIAYLSNSPNKLCDD